MKPLLTALIVARALDAATSCGAFAAGAREANPLFPTSCSAAVVTQGVTSAGEALGFAWLDRKGHPRLARTLTVVQLAVESAVVGNNVYQWRDQVRKNRAHGL